MWSGKCIVKYANIYSHTINHQNNFTENRDIINNFLLISGFICFTKNLFDGVQFKRIYDKVYLDDCEWT